MKTYQIVIRAYPRGKIDLALFMDIAKKHGATRVQLAYPRMWVCDADTYRRTKKHWVGYNQPKTVRFCAVDDAHAKKILDAIDPEMDRVFVESFSGYYV